MALSKYGAQAIPDVSVHGVFNLYIRLGAQVKSKVLNPPERIWLQVLGDDDTGDGFHYSDIAIEEITWHDEKIFDSDVEYRLVKRRSARNPHSKARRLT